MRTTQPEYDKIKDVNRETVIALNKFLRDIRNMNLSDDATIAKYIKDNKYTFTNADIREIVERTENVEYSVNLSETCLKFTAQEFIKWRICQKLSEERI